MFKFLPGIILIQLVTVGLTVTAFARSEDAALILIIAFFALIISFLASFWFAAIARNFYHESFNQLREDHLREKEKILINTEREKALAVAQRYQAREAEIRRAYAKANFKVGVVVTLCTGIGAILMLSQMVTFGLMLLVGSGSGLLGYLVRIRQERTKLRIQEIRSEPEIDHSKPPKLLQSK